MKHLLAGCVTAGTCLSSFASAPAAPEKPWNFLVILLDDAGWRDLGFAGNSFVETPNIDRLAAQGMHFNLAYSTHPFSAPSRQSLITGQWPARTAWMQRSEVHNPDAPYRSQPFSPDGVPGWTRRRPEFTSLAEALKSAGYSTAHIGKWHFGEIGGEVSPESEGFDVNFGGAQRVGAVKNFFAPFEGLPGNVASKPGEYLTDRLTEETIKFIRANKDHPFYVQLWHYAPHEPLMAPKEVVDKYRKKRQKLGDDSLNPTYAAMIDVVDQGVGRIRNELEKLGLSDRTVILLTSDNGARTAFGSIPITSVAPFRGEKGMIYQGGVREPLIIYWPGHTKPGSVSDTMVSLIDFYPTVLDIAGVPLPAAQPVDGVSLTPLLQTGVEPQLNDRPLFWYNVTCEAKEDGEIILPVASVRKNGWRLVKNFGRPLELYNLSDDPSESVNEAPKQPERTAELEKLLDNWLADTGVVTPTRNPFYNPDYVIPRQIKETEIPTGLKEIRSWNPGANDGKWKAARMIKTDVKNGALQMHAGGIYPEITTKDVSGLSAGLYAVQLELRVSTSGRIRFAWKDQAGKFENIEFFPQRDGEWHTLTAVFQSLSPISELRLAAPTHLSETGHYDPETQPDYIEVRSIRLLAKPADNIVTDVPQSIGVPETT